MTNINLDLVIRQLEVRRALCAKKAAERTAAYACEAFGSEDYIRLATDAGRYGGMEFAFAEAIQCLQDARRRRLFHPVH